MTNVAIFSCNGAHPEDIQTPGTKCYTIMALGAPAEWFYAITTISWSLTIALDIYVTPIVSKVKDEQDQAEMRLLASEQHERIQALWPQFGKSGFHGTRPRRRKPLESVVVG